MEEVNDAVKEVKNLLSKQRELVQHEYNMHVVAATSALTWKVVKQMEGGLDLPDDVTIDNSEVRAIFNY